MVIEITRHNTPILQLWSYSQIFCAIAMPKRKDTVTRGKAAGLLESHWHPPQVTKKLHVGRTTAYRWEERMQIFHGQIDRPEHLQMVSYSGSLVLLFLLTFLKNARQLNLRYSSKSSTRIHPVIPLSIPRWNGTLSGGRVGYPGQPEYNLLVLEEE